MTTTPSVSDVPTPVDGETRNAFILRVLRETGQVGVSDVARAFDVSEMTVRRDLSRLDREGLLRRIHGGATLKRPGFLHRAEVRAEEKARIAAIAAPLVGPAESVGIDIGTTCLAVATELSVRDDLLVVTNSLYAALEFQHSPSTAIVLGGRITSDASLVSPDPSRDYADIHLDKLILGCGGVSAAHGVSYFDVSETSVREILCENAVTTILVADQSKLDRQRAVSLPHGLGAIDVLVTSAEPSRELAAALVAAGVELLVADE